MASVLQTAFSLPSFQEKYLPTAKTHWERCTEPLPAECLDCQLHKLADGLLSGRYSHPRPAGNEAPKDTNPLAHDSPTPVFQEGIRPSMFKTLIGKGHAEFSTMRQQDSEEFFTHLISSIRRHLKKAAGAESDPTEVFQFGMEQRLQCNDCHKVRYRVDPMDEASVPVPKREKGIDADGKTVFGEIELRECLEILTGVEALEYTCPSCQKRVIAKKYVRLTFAPTHADDCVVGRQTKFATFPQVLVLHARKFQLVNWVPTKLGASAPLIRSRMAFIESARDQISRSLCLRATS